MKKYKRIILVAVLVGTAFAVGYSSMAVMAVYGRDNLRGYFTNTYDNTGVYVWNPTVKPNSRPTQGCSGNGAYAIPLSVNTKQEFIDFVKCKLDSTADNPHVRKQDKVGAAFIIQTMRGVDGGNAGCSRANCRPSNAQIADWEARILNPEVSFRANRMRTYAINSYYMGDPEAGLSTPNDDGFYNENGTQTSLVFWGGSGAYTYVLKHFCANPVGTGSLPPAPEYALEPHVDNISPTEVEANGKINVQTSVDNDGPISSAPTQWEITKMTVPPGQSAPHEGSRTNSNNAPCQSGGGASSGNHFQSGGTTCENVAKGSGRFDPGLPAGNRKPRANDVDVGDVPVGTRICFALSVQPRSTSSNQWAHSRPVCTVVGKNPKIQVWGGDVSVRGRIETGTTIKEVDGQTKTFGSWVEYGAFAAGPIDNFASGAGLNDRSGETTQSDWSKFTFANVDNSGSASFGRFTSDANFRPLATVGAFFGALPNQTPIGASSVDLSSLTFSTGSPAQVRTIDGDLTITGGNIPAGRSVVIRATGTVTITGNITYTDEVLRSVNDIPQVVIIGENVRIQDNVSRVDAWIVAEDLVDTCFNFSGNLTSDKCSTALEVNGPVVTNRLQLNRTAGSGSGGDSGSPAERFNLRPDAFLWARLQATGNSKAKTVYMVELPPRF